VSEEYRASAKRLLLFVALFGAFFGNVSVAGVADPTFAPGSAVRERFLPARAIHVSAADAKDADGGNKIDLHAVETSRSIARLKTKCAGCGVIESVRRIEIDEHAGGSCVDGDRDDLALSGRLLGGARKEVVTLADTIAGSVGIDESGKKVRRASGYQIVVRFRDGTRHVFTETTPRSLRLGDRILVVSPQRSAG